MSKKVLIIAGLAALVAGITGVAFAANGGTGKTAPTVANPTAAVTQVAADQETVSGDTPDGDTPVTDTPAAETTADQQNDSTGETYIVDGHAVEASASDEELPQTQAVLNDSYSLQYILDAESGEEVSPQVALGKYASSCYLNTYTDGNLELCINPSAEVVQKGIYSIYNDTIYVDFGDGRIVKYPIIYSENAVIESIIVSDGTYDYYFG